MNNHLTHYLHYKCCGDDRLATYWDEEVRRLRASGALKGYLDRLSSSNPMVVLGDWNDALTDPDPRMYFVLSKTHHYQFADLDIAQPENQQNWSFHPTQVTSITFVNRPLIPSQTKIRLCENNSGGPSNWARYHGYFQTLSDHRPWAELQVEAHRPALNRLDFLDPVWLPLRGLINCAKALAPTMGPRYRPKNH